MRIEGIVVKEISPKLIFIVSPCPDIVPDAVLDTTARRIHRPGIMGICGTTYVEVYAPKTY